MNTRTQWVVTMHFNRGITQTFRFDTKASALDCIRTVVFVNEDSVNFSCYREEVKKTSLEQKLDDIKYMLELKDRILNKM
jgi:hypothetical protein